MPDSVHDPGPADHGDADDGVTRRRLLTVGVPAAVALGAAGVVPFLIGRDATRLRSAETPATSSSPATTPPSTSAVFSPGAATQDVPILPGSTTSTTTTTVPATTPSTAAVVPSTLPTEPIGTEVPIDPPADPRGFEEEISLGGIAIPKLGVDQPLFEGIRLTTLDKGPGHWPGTAMPGQVGNVVVAAHRTSHGGPFRNIDQLVEGDRVVFTTADGTAEYAVTSTQIVEPDAIWIVDPTPDPTATLFACHPPGSVRQRIVVKLALV